MNPMIYTSAIQFTRGDLESSSDSVSSGQVYKTDTESTPVHHKLPNNCGLTFVGPTTYARGLPSNGSLGRPSGKVTGGKVARYAEFPSMVAIIGKRGKHLCGGSLISSDLVLTAAHCFQNYKDRRNVDKIRLHLGDFNIKSLTDGPHEVRTIKEIIKHEKFNITNYHNDIALVKLNEAVEYSATIQPVCVPQQSNSNDPLDLNTKVTVIGWGRERRYGRPSSILRKVTMPLWSFARCQEVFKIFAPGRLRPGSNMCAGDGKKNKDACIGDSGGPLLLKVNGVWTQFGIVSWGKGCGNFPGVYTRVDHYIPWLSSNI